MRSITAILVTASLVLATGTAWADQTTAPGQQKKAAGDGSAKEYAPGQQRAAEAEAEAEQAKQKTKKAKKKASQTAEQKAEEAKTKGKAK